MIADQTRFRVDRPLDEWLTTMYQQHPRCFPASMGDIVKSYGLLSDYLNQNVHTYTVEGDLLDQLKVAAQQAKGDLASIRYLNDHGPDHVKAVIREASNLLIQTKCELAPYEAYLLLLAIHFHDVGIIHGREKHEWKCVEVMNHPDVKPHVGDSTIQNAVRKVASAHGGTARDGTKDTIGSLTTAEMSGSEVRLPFLAAVVRFGDELSDGRGRARRFLRGGRIPDDSRIFHEYSESLSSVRVKEQEVSLVYELTTKTIDQDFAVPGTVHRRFLVEEIQLRLAKMHQERMYCMRFWPRESPVIKKISAKIEVSYPPGNIDSVPDGTSVLVDQPPIRLTFEESGYPGSTSDKCDLCQGISETIIGTALREEVWARSGRKA